MSAEADRLRDAAVERVRSGKGHASVEDRRAAFDDNFPKLPLIAKVAKNAWKVTDEDIAEAKKLGFTEDQLFELIVCAALGKSKRQYDAAIAVVDEAFR